MTIKQWFSKPIKEKPLKETKKPLILTYEVEKDGERGEISIEASYPKEAIRTIIFAGYTIIRLVEAKPNV